MKNGWQTKTLDQISTNLDSRRVSITKAVRTSGEYPYYGASGIVDYVADYIFDEDTLLISEDGANLLARSTPIAFSVSGKYWVNNHAHILKFENMTTQRFVELYLESIPLDDYITGAAQPKLNQKALNSIPIPVPPLTEQQRIVSILDEAFDGIATSKANAEKNLQNARALFESYLQSVFTQHGEGWVHSTIGDQLALQRGFDITKNQQHPGKVPVVSSGGIKSFHDKAMVKAPGVVIGRKGTLGKVFYLEDDYWPHDTTLWVKDFKGNDPRFIYYFFLGLDVTHLDSGTANPALNRNQVHPIEVDWPPLARQEAIVSTLDELRTETQRLESIYEQKLTALEELKKSLLHQAFTGEL